MTVSGMMAMPNHFVEIEMTTKMAKYAAKQLENWISDWLSTLSIVSTSRLKRLRMRPAHKKQTAAEIDKV
jgi:hypothetical protein